MTIVNDDSSIVSEQSFQHIDDARGVIYDRRMFIIQATGGHGPVLALAILSQFDRQKVVSGAVLKACM
jgi:hypothetical protein